MEDQNQILDNVLVHFQKLLKIVQEIETYTISWWFILITTALPKNVACFKSGQNRPEKGNRSEVSQSLANIAVTIFHSVTW